MKRYDLELTATGPVMEERKEGAFVPFSEISGLADTVVKMGGRCQLLADLLREVRPSIEFEFADGECSEDLLQRIDAALAGHVPAQRMPELNCSLRQILGRPNFSCITIAEALRLAGHAIERKAEHEQAAVIHWLLGFYFSHGDNWIDASRAALKDMRDAAMLADAPKTDDET